MVWAEGYVAGYLVLLPCVVGWLPSPGRSSFVRDARHICCSAAASRHERQEPDFVTRTWSDVPDLPPWLVRQCERLGFDGPSEVQAEALPVLLNGSDAVVEAPTGSGKTLAYLLPALAKLDRSRMTTQAIIIVPTRELGLQVSSVAKRLTAGSATSDTQQPDGKIFVMSLLEGSQNRRQRAWAWAEPPHVVVANPRTLETMLSTRGLKVQDLKMVVVDEVDACAAQDQALHNILGKYLSPTFDDVAVERGVAPTMVPESTSSSPTRVLDRQTVFLSASVPQHRHFLRQCAQRRWCLHDPQWLQLDHFYSITTPERKLARLRRILRSELEEDRVVRIIVFLNKDRPLQKIARVLEQDLRPRIMEQRGPGYGEETAVFLAEGEGVTDEGNDDGGAEEEEEEEEEEEGAEGRDTPVVAVLHEDAGLNARAAVMSGYRSGSHVVLLATDLAARGLDVPETSHVIQFDMPESAETYLHRAGRTGRMGLPGTVVTLAASTEEFVLQRLANGLSIQIEELGLS